MSGSSGDLAGAEEQPAGADGVRVGADGGGRAHGGHDFTMVRHDPKLPCRHGQPPRRRDLPVPAPARRQPGRLVPVGRGGLRARARRGQAAARLDRLLGLPLVPRDGARVLRGPEARRADERALRLRQGRPRGAPRRRRDLHGRGAGDDRPRRLAAERLHHPGRRALLRRHLLPARRRARACRAGRRCSPAITEAWQRAPRGDRGELASTIVARLQGAAGLDGRRPASSSPGCSSARSTGAAHALRRRARRLRRRAEVPAVLGDRVPARPRRARDVAAHAARDGQRRHLRPGRRRLRALRGRRALDRPALREDALRQRAARPRLPARLAGNRRPRCCGACARRRSTGCCASCARTTAASPPRWTPTPRASRASSTSGRSSEVRAALPAELAEAAIALLRDDRERGNFEGANIPVRAAADPPSSSPRSRPRCSRPARERVWPGLDDKRIASWNALAISALADAGAVLGRADLLDAARERRRLRARRRCATTDGRLLRTYNRGRAKLPAYLEDHAYLRRGAADALRGDLRGALVHRGDASSPTSLLARFGDPEHGGFFSTADDHEKLVARRKDVEDNPIPSGASAAASACCGWRR